MYLPNLLSMVSRSLMSVCQSCPVIALHINIRCNNHNYIILLTSMLTRISISMQSFEFLRIDVDLNKARAPCRIRHYDFANGNGIRAFSFFCAVCFSFTNVSNFYMELRGVINVDFAILIPDYIRKVVTKLSFRSPEIAQTPVYKKSFCKYLQNQKLVNLL